MAHIIFHSFIRQTGQISERRGHGQTGTDPIIFFSGNNPSSLCSVAAIQEAYTFRNVTRGPDTP